MRLVTGMPILDFMNGAATNLTYTPEFRQIDCPKKGSVHRPPLSRFPKPASR